VELRYGLIKANQFRFLENPVAIEVVQMEEFPYQLFEPVVHVLATTLNGVAIFTPNGRGAVQVATILRKT
jgi:hypothetical protein